jgi:hypothetical protein
MPYKLENPCNNEYQQKDKLSSLVFQTDIGKIDEMFHASM